MTAISGYHSLSECDGRPLKWRFKVNFARQKKFHEYADAWAHTRDEAISIIERLLTGVNVTIIEPVSDDTLRRLENDGPILIADFPEPSFTCEECFYLDAVNGRCRFLKHAISTNPHNECKIRGNKV